MNTFVPRPISEAQRVLRMLYDYRCTQSEPPKFEHFYPIDANQVVSVLGWELECVSSLRYSGIETIDATVDFDKKLITLSVDEKTPRERVNFSLAHEIGHILLHGEKGIRILSENSSFAPDEEKQE